MRPHHSRGLTPLTTNIPNPYIQPGTVKRLQISIELSKGPRHKQNTFPSSSSGNEYENYNDSGASEPNSETKGAIRNHPSVIKLVLNYYNKHQKLVLEE